MYGFFPDQASTSLPITSISRKEGSQFYVYFGYVNGTLSSGNHPAVFTVQDSKFDRTIGARAALILCASLQILLETITMGIVNNRTPRVPFSLNVLLDNKALQPPPLVPVSTTVDRSNELVMPFNVTILDVDGEWAWSRDAVTWLM